MEKHIRIASRSSTLAKIQAKLVGDVISRNHQHIKVDYHWIKTSGDLDQNLDISGGTSIGVFTSEISHKIISQELDIAIHSWKDYPIANNGKSKIYATLPRADMRDVLLLKKKIKSLGSLNALKIMTSSPRRRFSLEQNLDNLIPITYDKMNFRDLRGNIETRLKKFLNDKETDGIVLAKAAIDRIISTDLLEAQTIKNFVSNCLKQNQWIVLPLSSFPTAPGQGAIGIEIANTNKKIINIIETINDEQTFKNVNREKKEMEKYGGGCSQKIGVSVWNKNKTTVQSIFGITEQNKKLSSFKIINRFQSESTRKTSIKKNDVFPKDKREQNIFDRVQINRNDYLRKLKNSLIYITRKNVLANNPAFDNSCILWTSGLKSWKAAVKLGYWIHGTSDSMGQSDIKSLSTIIGENFQVVKLTFSNDLYHDVTSIDLYQLNNPKFPIDLSERIEFFWMSPLAFQVALEKYPEIKEKQHACGMGNTYKKLQNIIGDDNKIECYLSYEDWFKSLKD